MWCWLKSMMAAAAAGALLAQSGQTGARPGWPCVAGRAVDPSYLELSEGTGGQLFLFQKGEVGQAGVVMSASYTHPATVLRAVGHLSGVREFQVPVDSTIQSLLISASLQCRKTVEVTRPNGASLTAANAARSIDLQAGRILQVDAPEAGAWKVRLEGTGLFVLSVAAQTPVRLSGVRFDGRTIETHLSGEVSAVRIQMASPESDILRGPGAAEAGEDGVWRIAVTPRTERFRVVLTGTDAAGWPLQRTHPVLFRTEVGR